MGHSAADAVDASHDADADADAADATDVMADATADATADGSANATADATAETMLEVTMAATVNAKADDVVPRVTHFLHRIRGLHSLSDAELEELLYERRFELLPTPAQPLPGIPNDGEEPLPTHESIPSQQELHEALLGDSLLPGGYQCVANVLYPESVCWPAHCKISGPNLACIAEKEGAAREGDEATISTPLLSPAGQGSLAAQDQQTAGDGQLTASLTLEVTGFAKSDDGAGEEHSLRSPRKHSPKKANTVKSSSVFSRADTTLLPCEVTVCGMRVASTLRGLPVPVPPPAEAKMPLYIDEAMYKAALEKRERLEKALKLEGYRERRCCEKIDALEHLKLAETAHLEEVQKREARREDRRQALRAQLEKDVKRKEDEECAAKEVERQAQEKSTEAERKWQRHRERQKRLIEENAARTDEERLALRESARVETRPTREERQKTLKQMEAEDRAQRMRSAVQERPPLPPRPHDLPAPACGLDLGLAAQKARPPRFGAWAVQAKGVSGAYGLSPREHASVEGNLMRAVKGSGRMAQYER